MACQSAVQTPHNLFEDARRELAELKVNNTCFAVRDSEDEASSMTPEAHHELVSGTPCQGSLLPKYLPSQTFASVPYSVAEREAVNNPCLLTSSSAARGRLFDILPCAKKLKVKNTFIDGTESDDDDDDRPPMLKMKTMPCPARRFEADAAQHMDGERLSRSPEQPLPAVRVPNFVPLETRQPQLSKGSELHGSGNCKPCAWFWRQQGCGNGEDCQHCHLCTAAELRVRKKAKKLNKKQAGTQGGSVP
eukprot:TRINITY_DN502_c0_g1_i1.p1 TRINITY_DN502_c0_g1~~TRINITY_DN502_c0_g1_i1.p1  ORF type:complete len:248 (+),score=50.65 TRINITY_DN502_c0_g1_i1:97-840(+)